jgi:hypothetical protein
MGGKSSSSSSSSTVQETNQEDNRVAVEAGGIGIGAKANVNVTATDLGVVSATKEFLSNFVEGAGATVETITGAFERLAEQDKAAVREATERDAKEVTELTIKVIGAVLAAGALVVYLLKGKQ